MVEATMDPVVWLRKQLEEADVDLLREMVATFVQMLMSAEADAPYRPIVERRNGRTGDHGIRKERAESAEDRRRCFAR